MIKTFYAVVVSAIAAACFVAFPTLLQQVRATPQVEAVQVARSDAPMAIADCGQNAWPYLDAACLRNAGGSRVQPRDVRLVPSGRSASSAER